MSQALTAQVVAKFLMEGERFHAPETTELVWAGQVLTVKEVLNVKADWMWINALPTTIIVCEDNAGLEHAIWTNSGVFIRLV